MGLAQCAAQKSDRKLAEEIYPELDRLDILFPISGAFTEPLPYFLARLAEVMGDYDDAERRFQEAYQVCKEAPSVPGMGWVCLDFSNMLLNRDAPGDSDRASQLQDEAIEIAQNTGMKPLLTQVLAKREILKA
jgi:tetratricopeptide (TPR) repeat protein